MQATDALEAQQQPFELVFPREDTLDSVEAFFKYFRIEEPLGSRLGLLPIAFVERNVRLHAAVEDRLAVSTAIVRAVKAHDCAFQIKADLVGDSAQMMQPVDEQRRFVTVAGKRRLWAVLFRRYSSAIILQIR
jgi:hypothetical protein